MVGRRRCVPRKARRFPYVGGGAKRVDMAVAGAAGFLDGRRMANPRLRPWVSLRQARKPGAGREKVSRAQPSKGGNATTPAHFRHRPASRARLRRRKEKPPQGDPAGVGCKALAMTYSRMRMHTTIGAAAFHFRVRNGIGWFHSAMVTRERVEVAVRCGVAHALVGCHGSCLPGGMGDVASRRGLRRMSTCRRG